MQTELSTKQAAEYLGVAPKTLANWRAEGTGPHFTRFLNRCRYSMEDLKHFHAKKSEKIHTDYFMTSGLMMDASSLFTK